MWARWLLVYLASIAITVAEELYVRKETSDNDILDRSHSLSDLVNMDKLPSEWKTGGDLVLEQGRLRFTPVASSQGSIWHNSDYQIRDSFTVEWTFRSVDFIGKSEGGLSFWIVNGKSVGDNSLFGGPQRYDGLQILVDSNGPVGSTVRGILNDGTKKFTETEIYDQTFGYCLLAYQDTAIPTTVRLSYDRKNNNLLKLQIDNRVCFQTREIQFPSNAKMRLGITAKNDKNKESFEILKMHTHNGLTKEVSLPNVNPMEQPRLVTKIINKETGKEDVVETDFMKMKGLANKVDNYELYKKLDKIEGKILANDISIINEKLEKIIKTQNDHSKKLDHLLSTLDVMVSSMGKEGEVNTEAFKDFFGMNDKLEKLLQDQAKIREETKLSMQSGGHGVTVDEIVKRLFIWMLPLILIVLVMAYYTFRIRQDIVKVKLL
ncbi:Protein EMP47 [Kluyveromyces marxianus]